MVDATEDGSSEISPRLSAEQIARLEPYATRQAIREGDLLFDEGDTTIDFFVVLSGAVEIRQYVAEGFRVVVRPDARQFIGDLSTLSGRAAVVQARTAEDGEVLRISPQQLQRVVVEDSDSAI